MRSLRLVALLAIPAQVAFAQQPRRIAAPRSRSKRRSRSRSRTTRSSSDPERAAERGRAGPRAVRALLPQSSASFSTRYNQGGTQYVQGVALPAASSDSYSSRYSLSA